MYKVNKLYSMFIGKYRVFFLKVKFIPIQFCTPIFNTDLFY
jgi:hypothetical protein